MFDAKHTPPPWEVRDLAVWSRQRSDGRLVKVLDSPSGDLDQIEKDLQLAATSPELLDALEGMIRDPHDEVNILTAHLAIAKARGELDVVQ